MTFRTELRKLRDKHWRIAESSGSLGFFGIIALIVAAVLMFWKPFLGRFSMIVAFVLCVLVPLFNL